MRCIPIPVISLLLVLTLPCFVLGRPMAWWSFDEGEVKVNITKPVESYLGPAVMSKDIPSEW